MTIKPLLDRVVLKVEEAEEKTKSGIILYLCACIFTCDNLIAYADIHLYFLAVNNTAGANSNN